MPKTNVTGQLHCLATMQAVFNLIKWTLSPAEILYQHAHRIDTDMRFSHNNLDLSTQIPTERPAIASSLFL